MKKLRLLPFVVMGAVACSSDPSVNVSGQWAWMSTFNSASEGITCVVTGDILLDQSISGTMVIGRRAATDVDCGAGNPTLEQQLATNANVLNASVNGNTISMEINFCDYEGTVSLDTPTGDMMSGTFECANGLFGILVGVITGTWEASK